MLKRLRRLKTFWAASAENRMQVLLVLGMIILPAIGLMALYVFFINRL